MTLIDAKMLQKGDLVQHVSKKNADGTPMRAKVTLIKTWKTRPECIELHLKHGLYDYAVFGEYELDQLIKL